MTRIMELARLSMKAILSNTLRLLELPPDLYAELTARMQMPNPKWIENERMKRWNRGTPRILKFYRRIPKGGLVLPRGFIRQLMVLVRNRGETVDLEDRRRVLPEVELAFNGDLKDFQLQAVEIMGRKDFGTLSAPTGSGKTVMALSMIARRRQPTLIVVHTKELAFQWIERIGTFLGIASDEVGLIGSGRLQLGKRISVALVQSLYKHSAEIAPAIGHLVVDECHRAPSRTFTEAVTAFDSRFMLGLSATPFRRDGLSKLIYWHLGDLHHEIDKAALVAHGDLLDIDVIFRQTDFKPYSDPIQEYSQMLSELTADDARNQLIAGDVANAAQHGRSNEVCLVLSDRKQHCGALQAILKYKHHVAAEVLTGDLSMEERRAVIRRVEEGGVSVLIATGQLIGEGFDCPTLSTLFMATPVRFSGRLLQYLGRILRPAEGIERARVYDYVDVHVPPLLVAAKARQQVYASKT
jgi:superfamily II DNA or RNA helicase